MNIIYCILLFSFIDFVLYNVWGKDYENQKVNVFRAFMLIIQLVLTGFLFFETWVNALCFNLLWWFGVADLLYYVYDLMVLKIFGYSFEDENGQFWKKPLEYKMSWLWFTPMGLMLQEPVTKGEFLEQCVFGSGFTAVIYLSNL